MIRSFRSRYVGPSSDLSATFAPRLNLVTGDNGLGKSFLLEALWWALTRDWAGPQALPIAAPELAQISARFDGKARVAEATGRFQPESQTWVPNSGRPPNPGLVLYAAVDGSFSAWDPVRNYALSPWVKARRDSFERSTHLSPTDLWEGKVDEAGRVRSNGLLRDWVDWQARGDQRFAVLEAVMGALSETDQPLTPGPSRRLFVEDARLFPTITMPYGDVPVIHASAGHRRVLALAYVLVWAWHEHLQAAALIDQAPVRTIVLMFDEIEAHLHPKWQRTLLPSLLRCISMLSDGANLQLIGATHSPILVASVENLVTAQDKLFTLDLDDGPMGREGRLHEVPWDKHVTADAWLRSDAFDLPFTGSAEQQAAYERAASLMSGPTTITDLDGLVDAVRDVIPAEDALWARIRFLRQRLAEHPVTR